MKPDVYVSKAAHVEGFPKSFEKIGGTISGQNRLSLTNIYYYVEKLNCIIVLIWQIKPKQMVSSINFYM